MDMHSQPLFPSFSQGGKKIRKRAVLLLCNINELRGILYFSFFVGSQAHLMHSSLCSLFMLLSLKPVSWSHSFWDSN